MVQWLGPSTFTHRAWVQSLVGELRSLKPRGMAKKKKKAAETLMFTPLFYIEHIKMIKKSSIRSHTIFTGNINMTNAKNDSEYYQ